jgi:hypothetical protein
MSQEATYLDDRTAWRVWRLRGHGEFRQAQCKRCLLMLLPHEGRQRSIQTQMTLHTAEHVQARLWDRIYRNEVALDRGRTV